MIHASQSEPWVYLVGAGPGRRELLTLKAARLLGRADAVVYDRLVGPAILELVPADATRIDVGRSSGAHHLRQTEINELLVRLACPGRVVVRLEGGDPFIFGRGCEEAEYLQANGIPFEVVPGVTAASGCSAAACISLTHRGLATGVRFVTGHGCLEMDLPLDWASLADPDTTLVIDMGLANLGKMCARLIEHGLPANTPAAAIAGDATPAQTTVRTTLVDLPADVGGAALRAPVLFVIGRVVGALARSPATWLEMAGDLERVRHG